MHKSLSTAPLKKLLFAVAIPKKALRVALPELLSALTTRKLGAELCLHHLHAICH